MSPQTFKAQVAVGSWATTPLFSGLSDITSIIEKVMGNHDVGDDENMNIDIDSDSEDELDVELMISQG